jgi:hypothetical protein
MPEIHDEDLRHYWSNRHAAQRAANDGQVAHGALDAVVQFEPDKGWVAVLYAARNIPEAWEDGFEVQTPATKGAEIFRTATIRAAELARLPAKRPPGAPRTAGVGGTRRTTVTVVAPGTVKPPWER